MEQDEESNINYYVVVNEEEQYSIWPDFKDIPLGWKKEGKWGPKQDCLSHINTIWKDMRPLSLRAKLEERRQLLEMLVREASQKPSVPPALSRTVAFLTNGLHPIRIHSSENTPAQFQKALNRGTLHIIFEDTLGETCLRIDFLPPHSALSIPTNGIYNLEGSLELDLIPLRCIAAIHLETMRGEGKLEYIT